MCANKSLQELSNRLKDVGCLVGFTGSSSSFRMQKPHLKPRKYNEFVSIQTVVYELTSSLATVLFD
jgi:hypothetical protein